MAFDKSDESKPIGSFKQPVDGKLIDCSGGQMVYTSLSFQFASNGFSPFPPPLLDCVLIVMSFFLSLFVCLFAVRLERRHAHE
jgi:hypothetical protein